MNLLFSGNCTEEIYGVLEDVQFGGVVVEVGVDLVENEVKHELTAVGVRF